MRLTIFIIIFSVLFAKVGSAGIIIETLKSDNSELIKVAVNILELCYADRINTVGLAGMSCGTISEALVFKECVIPVIFIGNTSRRTNNNFITPKSQHKLQHFVVTIGHFSDLQKTFALVKNSIWWNHMASFLLLDWPSTKSGCSNAYEILHEAWKVNLLNSNLLCLHHTRGMLIYTYNPYTRKAPVPWQLENNHNGKDHTWSLFARVYQENEKNCKSLNFDKTRDLDGYEIRASVRGLVNWWTVNPNVKLTIYNRVQRASVKILMDSLNTTWRFREYHQDDLRPNDEKGEPYGVRSDILRGVSDISFNIQKQESTANFTTTYPHFLIHLAIMTQYNDHMSQLGKIVSFLDSKSRFGLLLVFLIVLLFFKFYLRKPLILAILDFVLIVCNMALLKIPKKLAPRILMGSLFIFMLTIHGIYQGKIKSLLTKQVFLRSVNTLEELEKFGYTIYGHWMYNSFFEGTIMEKRYVELTKYNCTEYTLRDNTIACTNEINTIITEADRCKLHVSNKVTINAYGAYLIRSDWPLEERVNAILRRCFEGDVLRPLFSTEISMILNNLKSYENPDEDQIFKALRLKELKFAFVILGVGLVLATITFIIEVGNNSSRIAKLRARYKKLIKLAK